MKIISVVGARPQFVKLAPVARALQAAGHEHVIVHSGQHYDANMSDVFFSDLAIPEPDVHLGIGSGNHGDQTGRMLQALEPIFQQQVADWVLIYGDTNSTLAGALAAVKLGIPVAHLEAGLRSFNRAMPEEHNRVLSDHAADLLLAPTAIAMQQLDTEGLGERSVLVGDVMADICLRVLDNVRGSRPKAITQLIGKDAYILATVHRPANTDRPERLGAIVSALQQLAAPVVLAAHPRLVARAEAAGLALEGGAVRVTEPLSYPDMVAAVSQARAVITDSGGLQKEAYLIGTPATTLRTETEWPETLDEGWNVLVPGDDLSGLGRVALRAVPNRRTGQPYGDGHAAEAVVKALESGPAHEMTSSPVGKCPPSANQSRS